ncbi:MAG: molybdopterin-dependent oxidoreductase, partial [Deltaproteobacteria bacterium]|nr:molybdopterin-dependent oxidoreductase [Deltaproteobacteria bacterium]
MGLAVQRAAQDLKRQLLRHAAKALGTKPERLLLSGGTVRQGSPRALHGAKGQSLSYEKLIHRIFLSKGGELVGRGMYQDIKTKKAALGSPTTFWE